MEIRIYKDEKSLGKAAAGLFAAEIIRNPKCVLGMATGSTPLNTYNELIELFINGIVDFSGVRTFNLDEYVGIGREHKQSYYRFMFDNLFSKVNINPENVNVPHPVSEDLEDDCAAYDEAIKRAGGIDLQILGIGHNGHIAFNEPAKTFKFGTHIVNLTPSTIAANQRFFNNIDEVPKKAMTMGAGSIMKAREIMILATGEGKAQAVKAMIKGDVDPMCPASVLQLHPKVTVFLDKSAASLL